MIKYWIKILNHSESSLVKNVYMLLKSDTDVNNNYMERIGHIKSN